MDTPYLQIQKDTLHNSVEAILNQEPSMSYISTLREPLQELAKDYDNVHLTIKINEALNLGLIELILSLRKLSKKKITVTLDASQEITELARNTGVLTFFENE